MKSKSKISTSSAKKSRSQTNKKVELKYYGWNGCLALAKMRPNDIVRIYISKKRSHEISGLLKWCAEQKKAYHIVSNEELDGIASSVHHEGICILAKRKRSLEERELSAHLQKSKDDSPILVLDGVQNPHNIGAIARTAAHFGFRYILLDEKKSEKLSAAAHRIAQGGLEYIDLCYSPNLQKSISQLKKQRYKVFSLEQKAPTLVYQAKFPKNSVFILGNEVSGVSTALSKLCDQAIQIPGTQLLESLNVSSCSSIIMSECWRQWKM